MAFAIFYNIQDLTPIAAQASNVNLTGGLKTYANRLWNGGVKNWFTAPIAAPQYVDNDPDGRMLVISGPQLSKQATIDWLYAVAAAVPGAWYMATIAEDMQGTAIEPWP